MRNIRNINLWVGSMTVCIRDEGGVKYDIDDHFWDLPVTILTKVEIDFSY